MKIGTYRYGEGCGPDGIWIGAARHLPRGVRKDDYQLRGYFDVWVPALAPSAELVSAYRGGDLAFRVFASRYRKEMKHAEASQIIRLLAAIARVNPVRVGCFCEDESRCHRSILRKLIEEAEAALPPAPASDRSIRLSSPPCSMPEISD